MLLATGLPELHLFPRTVRESLLRTDSALWWQAICTEFDNCESKKVWKIVHKSTVPKGRKIIGNRWVLSRKDDGRYRARTVAKGFSQIPGKDFQENHAPVVNDTTFHLILVLKIKHRLSSRQFDVVTAFLYGILEEELFMDMPEGYIKYLMKKYPDMKYNADEYCLLLLRALYGLVQAARQWYKKITDIFATLNFYPSPADPCLFVYKRKDNEPPAFIILYVDDGAIIATEELIEKVLKALSKLVEIKDLGKIKHFVGCHVIESPLDNTIYIHQPKLLKHLQEEFGKLANTSRCHNTPGAPKTVIMRPDKTDPVIDATRQSSFRSAVGMLLYLIKHSRPDLSNAVRELTKVLDGATEGHWLAMLRVVKYTLETKNYVLKIHPSMEQEGYTIEAYSDSEYGGDRETRASVYGFITFFCGAPVSWKSKSNKSITLSTTEAEYFASSETAKEMMFIKNIIETIGELKRLEMPMTLRIDNTGAIYLANNQTTGQRTKHIDIRTHFVRNMINDGTIKTKFVKSADNHADLFTKNCPEDAFNLHSSIFMMNMNKTFELGQIIFEDADEEEYWFYNLW
jgi:hypothetical protein